MRVFLYEFMCASSHTVGHESLRAEGEAMMRAARQDLEAIPGVSVEIILPIANESAEFANCVRSTDLSIIVAPESDGILFDRCEWVRAAGGTLLGSTAEAIRLCTDKLALGKCWSNAGVLTPTTCEWPLERALPFTGDAVLKPRDGAGCVDTFRGVPANLPNGRFIVQPWIDGISASVSFMIGPSSCVNLLPVSQRIVERSGKLHYAGGQLPLDEETAKRAIRVGLQAVQAVRGLAGYVGVDVILGDDGRDWAIEINPRITTSYIALRRACQTNLMEALLQVWNGQTPTLAWRDETISFTP